MMASEWQSDAFRASLMRKLEEAIRESAVSNQRSPGEMESQVFRRSTTKEEYLSYMAKLILHVKQQGRNIQNQDGSQNMGGMNQGIQQGQGQQQRMMTGTGMQPQQLQQQQQQQQQNRMQMQRMPVSQHQQMMMQQQQHLQAQLRNRMQQPGMPGGPTSMSGGPGGMPVGPGMAGGPSMAGGPGMTGGPGMAGGPGMGGMPGGGPRMSQLQQALQQRAQVGPDMQQNIRQPAMPRGMGGAGYQMRPGPPSTGPPSVGQGPSPIPYAQSPQSQMGVLSPMGNPVPSPVSGQRSNSLAPSPSSQVNTPMNPVNQEEREYLEKLKSLERYIEPLRRVIRRHGNEDNEKLAKMKKLLDILSNPDKRVPLVTLQKCEDVLKRMQLDTTDSDTADINLQANPDKNPLIDAVLKLQQNAKDGKGVSLNNSLANTFIPPIETVLGQEISLPPLPRTPPPEPAKERVPDLLQGEIARLDHRFKVMFASSQPDYHSSAIDLLCCLEDKDLPAVPHLRVSIPPNYPDYPPAVDLEKLDFLTTPFLQEVTEALSSRLNRMPHKYTLSQLLTAWELAVRSACPPSHLKNINQPTPLFTI